MDRGNEKSDRSHELAAFSTVEYRFQTLNEQK